MDGSTKHWTLAQTLLFISYFTLSTITEFLSITTLTLIVILSHDPWSFLEPVRTIPVVSIVAVLSGFIYNNTHTLPKIHDGSEMCDSWDYSSEENRCLWNHVSFILRTNYRTACYFCWDTSSIDYLKNPVSLKTGLDIYGFHMINHCFSLVSM